MSSPYDMLSAAVAEANPPPSPYDALSQAVQANEPQGSGGPMQGLKDILGFAGRQVDRVSAAPLRGAEEGIQNYEPEGGGFHPGVLGAMLKGAGRGVANPDQVQPAAQMFQRMGVSDAPTSQLQVMGTNGQPMSLRQDRGGDPSLAATLGAAQDALAPIPPAGLALKGIVKGADLAKTGLKGAAVKSILSHYSPRLLADLAPEVNSLNAIKKAPTLVAEKLKANDLLYTPGKANFNLQKSLKDYGSQIAEEVKQATSRDVTVNAQSVLDNFAKTKASILEQTGEGAASHPDLVGKALPQIQGMIDRLKPNELGGIPVNKAVNFRRELQEMVKNWDPANKNLIQGVAKELSTGMNQEIAKSDKIFGPKLAALNEKYSDLKDLQPVIEDAYTKAFGKAAAGKGAHPLSYTRSDLIDKAKSPVKTIFGMIPKLAEKIANHGNIATELNIQEFAGHPGVTAEDVAALKKQFMDNGPIGPGYLSPRTPQGRPTLNPQPSYAPGAPREGLPPRVPQNVRRSFQEQAPTYVPGAPIEGLPPRTPQPAHRRPLEIYDPRQDANHIGNLQAPRDALENAPLAPRRPRGDVQSNFPPKYIESPQIAKVLDNLKRMELPPQAVARIEEALKTSTGAERGKLIYDLQKAYRDWKGK